MPDDTDPTAPTDPEVPNTLTATYVAENGGSIRGNAVQKVEIGGSSEEVEAVADNGYKFVIWSDGITNAKRSDDNLTEDFSVTAKFAKSSATTFSVTYTSNNYKYCDWASEHVEQAPINGKTTVTAANPSLGYRFVCWSDGVTSTTRQDDYRNEDKTIEAQYAVDSLEIPVMIINTENGQDITTKDNYENCYISVINAEEKYCFTDKLAGIRGRGNSTWAMDKKPYKLKFDKKINLFGNGNAKKWTLIANHDDYSMARNYMAYSLGAQFDAIADTTTTIQYVDVYLNGRYDGVYLVCEQMETGSTRVDIEDDLEKFTDPEDLGFLIEWDKRVFDYYYGGDKQFVYDGDYYFRFTNYNEDIPFTIKSPDSGDAQDLGLEFKIYVDYIQAYIDNAFDVLWSGDYNRVQALFDVDTWAEGYILDELFHNVDVAYSSFYMYKDEKDGKLYRGPIWDYDISSGNCNYDPTVIDANYLRSANNNVMYRKLLEYPKFKALVAQKLNGYKNVINATLDNCVTQLSAYTSAFERNFERWELLNNGNYVGPWNPVPDNLRELETWQEQVDYLRNWLSNCLTYMLSRYTIN